jgi:hypothetical protein
MKGAAEHHASYVCDIQHCREVCSNLKLFLLHLREHVNSNTAVNCPFEKCNKKFEGVVESMFHSHISCYHKHSTHACLKDQYFMGSEEVFPFSNDICDTEHERDTAGSEIGS